MKISGNLTTVVRTCWHASGVEGGQAESQASLKPREQPGRKEPTEQLPAYLSYPLADLSVCRESAEVGPSAAMPPSSAPPSCVAAPPASHLVLKLLDEGLLPGQLLLGRLQEPRVLFRGLGEHVQLLRSMSQVLTEHVPLLGDRPHKRRNS